MNYSEIKKLDEESLQLLTEGSGPADECICSILSPIRERKSLGSSIKKVFASIKPGKKKRKMSFLGHNSVQIPITYNKGGKGVYTRKEALKRTSECGKCGCDENIVLNHSYANISILTPDISSICPCPTDCLPDKEKLRNNIEVTIERAQLDVDAVDSEFSIYNYSKRHVVSEPELRLDKRSIRSLIDAQCNDDLSEWSSGEDY